MPEFYTWAILLRNQQDEIGERQLSVFGSRGGQNSHLMHVPLSTVSFYISWSIRNYKDQTDNKLPEIGLCAHIILKTRVLQVRPGKGMQLSHRE